MRHLVALPVVAALTLTGALGGCAQLGLPTISPTDVSTDTAAFVSEVQTLTVAACGFVPAASTITGLVTAGNSAATAGLALGSTIANLICTAVKTIPAPASVPAGNLKSSRYGDLYVGRVRGVPVFGHFE